MTLISKPLISKPVSDHGYVTCRLRNGPSVGTWNVRNCGEKKLAGPQGQKIIETIDESDLDIWIHTEFRPSAFDDLAKALPEYELVSGEFALNSEKQKELVVFAIKKKLKPKFEVVEYIIPASKRRGALCAIVNMRIDDCSMRVALCGMHIFYGDGSKATVTHRFDDAKSIGEKFKKFCRENKVDHWIAGGDYNVDLCVHGTKLEIVFDAKLALRPSHGPTTSAKTKQIDGLFFGGDLSRQKIETQVFMPPSAKVFVETRDADRVKVTRKFKPDKEFFKNYVHRCNIVADNWASCVEDGYINFSQLRHIPGIGEKTINDLYDGLKEDRYIKAGSS